MNNAFFPGLLIFLQVSIYVNIRFFISYIIKKKESSQKKFFITTLVNSLTGIVLLAVMMLTPEGVARFELQTMMILESGLIFFFLIFVKVTIAVRVLKRAKEPEYYDISFFGKKVYKPEVVKKSELAIFILTVPFTLITGAYFVANIFFG